MIRDDLERLIRRDYHPDYWADDVAGRAAELVAKLEPADWTWLGETWPSWPPGHQRQLADALAGSGPAGWPILTAMLRSADAGVAMQAAEALQPDPAWPGDASLEPDLRRLRDVVEPELADIPEDLIRRGRTGGRATP
ncbi:hypothetical protein [Amycolatopsis vancoresmycina]|uniref:hypothetical protein n=1 Tax=Amycolatopsis vancoresmycina TaxID=208444 RepID=UPI0003A42D6F|nr:hypothetical protein [Amycolatopsis vancoresmycina]